MITVKRKVNLGREAHGRRRVATTTPKTVAVEPGRVPRISRLMALAIRLDDLLRSGGVVGIAVPSPRHHRQVCHPRKDAPPDRGRGRLGEAAGDVVGR